MERKKIKPELATGFMSLMFIVGFIGFNNNMTKELFKLVVPVHLLITAIILFYFHRENSSPSYQSDLKKIYNENQNFIIWAILTALSGFFVEVIGVKTSLIFGDYSYGKTLGLKLFDVPLMIGVNWVVLAYCTSIIADKTKSSVFIKSLFAAFLMILVDYFIEPVAINYDYWSWSTINIPLQNYTAWFVISFIMALFFYKLKVNTSNPLALPIYFMQLIFFMGFGLV